MSDVNNMQSEGRGAKVAGSLLGSPWCHSSHGICMTREWDTHDLVSSTVYRKIIFVYRQFQTGTYQMLALMTNRLEVEIRDEGGVWI